MKVNYISLYLFSGLINKFTGFNDHAEQRRGNVEENENRPVDLGKDSRNFTC